LTVTTSDIARVATRVRAEIDALTACAPAHADMIAAGVLSRVAADLKACDAGIAVTTKRRNRIATG